MCAAFYGRRWLLSRTTTLALTRGGQTGTIVRVSAPFLELHDLAKSYASRVAVHGVSLSIAAGTIIGLLGPNGAGKSTLMGMLTGLLSPSAGDIFCEGKSITADGRAWRRSLGVVLEDLALFEYLSVGEQLRLAARLAGVDGAETERRAEELLSFFQLSPAASTVAAEASQGTRQKLACAMALIHAPRLLLLDEALNGIDAVTVSRMKGLLRRLAARGVTVIISSHVLDAIEPILDRGVIVNEGRIVREIGAEGLRASGKSLESVYVEAVGPGADEEPALSWLA
jgi:ABC-2 type transport system ATP-binding protein